MRTLFRYTNNGVTAVVTEEVYGKMEERRRLADELRSEGYEGEMPPTPGPIFTFVNKGYLSHENYAGFVTGSYEDLDRLTADAVVVERFIHVPFSNCTHLNGSTYDLRYRATLAEVLEAFGLEPTPAES